MAFHLLACPEWNFLPATPMAVFVCTHSIYLIYHVYQPFLKTRAFKLSQMMRHESLHSEWPLHFFHDYPASLCISNPSPASSWKSSWIPVPTYWHSLALLSDTLFLWVLDSSWNCKFLEGKHHVLWFLWVPALIFHLSSCFPSPQTQQDNKLGTLVQGHWWLLFT